MGDLIKFPHRGSDSAGRVLDYFTVSDNSLNYGEYCVEKGSVVECILGTVEWGELHAIEAGGKPYIRILRKSGNEVELSTPDPTVRPATLPPTAFVILGIIHKAYALHEEALMLSEVPLRRSQVNMLPAQIASVPLEVVEASQSGAVFWRADGLGRCITISNNWPTITGRSYEEIAKGWGYIKAIHPDDRERAARRWYESVKAGNAHKDEYRLQHTDGSIRECAVRAARIDLPDGLSEWIATTTLL